MKSYRSHSFVRIANQLRRSINDRRLMKDYRSGGPLVQRLSALPVNKGNNLSEFDERCGVSFTACVEIGNTCE